MRAPIPPSADVSIPPDVAPAVRGRILLETNLPLIQRKLRSLSRHGGLPPHEVEEFRSWALVKLIEDDYRILGRWEGRSTFSGYLTVVLRNLLRDYQIRLWGKWRPCAASRRSGQEIMLLERLLVRDKLSVAEAVERLRIEQGISRAPDEVERLAAAFPRRQEWQQVSDSELLQVPIDGQVEIRIEEAERARIASRVHDLLVPLLQSLPAEDRLILKLYFFDGFSMAAISPRVGRPQKELFAMRNRCLKKLRRSLDKDGLGLKQAREIFGHFCFDMKELLLG
jgi:RNA polymerase sigma factor (sigma-70 family)